MRANILLLAGIVFGIILAASGLLDKQASLALESNSIAKVNDVSIAQSQYESLIKGIADKKTKPLEQEEYEYILEKLIDEELMVQRGQELGLLQLNSVLRNNMIQALTTSILSENASSNVDESILKEFYEDNKSFFRSSEKISFQYMKFISQDQAELAQQAIQNGEEFNKVKETMAEKEIISIPNTLLSMANIRQYFGPTLAEQLSLLPIQSLSPIIPSNNGQQTVWYLFYIHEKELSETPDFENIKEVVSSEYRRSLDEKAMHDYILWLRKRADIQIIDANQLSNVAKTAQ